MATSRNGLTEEDIRALVRGTDEDERATAAHKICRSIDQRPLSDPLTPQERAAAHEILRVMAADAAESVRRALAVTLKSSPVLPRDVALKLARDVEAVAVPVLNFSPAFTDADLAELVRQGTGVKQAAIAYRPELSQTVTTALADYGVEEALRIACANDNADFSEAALLKTLERFPHSDAVKTSVGYRAALPLVVAERLTQVAGEALREHLQVHYGVAVGPADELAADAAERATVDLAEQAAAVDDASAFATHLAQTGRLTASLLLRTLAQGNIRFFEHGVAQLAGVPHPRTWMMIHDAGPLGLRAIYERAGLPARLFPAFRAGVDTYRSVHFEGAVLDREKFRERMIQRFLTQHQGASREDLEYLLERLDAAGAPAAPAERAANAA
ncbi:MAG: DUF2336 domain-containing protein [Proteobacteria bacterium]|nr:DUF2336 domain-containing protein [Pseudomonadota bacterium]